MPLTLTRLGHYPNYTHLPITGRQKNSLWGFFVKAASLCWKYWLQTQTPESETFLPEYLFSCGINNKILYKKVSCCWKFCNFNQHYKSTTAGPPSRPLSNTCPVGSCSCLKHIKTSRLVIIGFACCSVLAAWWGVCVGWYIQYVLLKMFKIFCPWEAWKTWTNQISVKKLQMLCVGYCSDLGGWEQICTS